MSVSHGDFPAKHVLVCIPGPLGTGESDFDPQVKHLWKTSNDLCLLTITPTGYGKHSDKKRDWSVSSTDNGNLDTHYHRDAAEIVELLAEKGVQEYSLLGWADGATTAALIASKHPDAVKSLICCAGHLSVDKEDMDRYDAVEGLDTWPKKVKEKFEEIYGLKLQKMWTAWVEAQKQILKHGGTIVDADTLSHVKAKTLIMHGALDELTSMRQFEEFKRDIPEAVSYVFSNGKHNFHQLEWVDFNILASNFVSSSLNQEQFNQVMVH